MQLCLCAALTVSTPCRAQVCEVALEGWPLRRACYRFWVADAHEHGRERRRITPNAVREPSPGLPGADPHSPMPFVAVACGSLLAVVGLEHLVRSRARLLCESVLLAYTLVLTALVMRYLAVDPPSHALTSFCPYVCITVVLHGHVDDTA